MPADQCPTLKEMGISPGEVERYTTRIEGEMDVLKVYFHRYQGDWIAKSKKFKFRRVHKNMPGSGHTGPLDTTESSPYLLRALAELDSLVAKERSVQDKKALLLAELDHLETVMSRKIEDLRHQIDEL